MSTEIYGTVDFFYFSDEYTDPVRFSYCIYSVTRCVVNLTLNLYRDYKAPESINIATEYRPLAIRQFMGSSHIDDDTFTITARFRLAHR